MIRFLAALTLAATPAAAQDVIFDSSYTEICVAAKSDIADMEACIGKSAEQCMIDTPGGLSTAGMGGCLDRELAYWDARLNDSYQRVLARMEGWDADKDDGQMKEAPFLRDMQRAWIPYRDATCDYERSRWGGGTGGGPAILACLAQLTGRQAIYIEAADLNE